MSPLSSSARAAPRSAGLSGACNAGVARGPLTHREAEVAALVAQGRTNRDSAGQLCLSVRTVEVHVDHILAELRFHTRTQLAAWAHEEGLLAENT